MMSHLQDHPDTYTGCLMLVALGGPAAACILGSYIHRLFKQYMATPSASVRYTLCVALAPLIFEVAKMIVVLAPRWWAWSFFIAATYESAVLVSVLRLVCIYLGGPGQDVEALSSGSPNKVWAAQPFCCLWLPFYVCMARRQFNGGDLFVVQILVFQRVFLAPFEAFLAAVERRGASAPGAAGAGRSRIEIASLLLALYGLLVLMRAAERSSEQRAARMRNKLWALGGVLVANMCIFHLMSMGIIATRLPGEEMTSECEVFPGGCYAAIDVTAARSAGASAVALVPLAVFLRQAFPAAEAEIVCQESDNTLPRGLSAGSRRASGADPSSGLGLGLPGAGGGTGAGGPQEEEEESMADGVE